MLAKQLAFLDQAISKTANEISVIETRITEKSAEQKAVYFNLERKLKEYSEIFVLDWIIGDSRHGDHDSLEIDSQIRAFIQIELDAKRRFDDEKARLENDNKKKIAELKKLNPGKLHLFERRKIQKLLDDEESKNVALRGLKYPRAERLIEVKNLLRRFDLLGTSQDRRRLDLLRKNLAKTQEERDLTERKTTGEAFNAACTEFVNAERARRREMALERERLKEAARVEAEREALNNERREKRQKAARKKEKELQERLRRARVSALRTQVTKSEKFLRDNSDKAAQKRLQAANRVVQNLELQCARAEQACIRKVRQLQLNTQSHLIPQFQDQAQLLVVLTKRDWIHIPALDNLVARLREKYDDLASARAEVIDAKKLVENIKRAQNIINEYNKSSHLLSKNIGKTKGIPPRIPVENWDDAEELAVRYIKWLGYADARRTGAGSDEGKDVESSKCVAQVKDLGTGATRPMLQQLFGVASAEKKTPIFFSRSYARTAMEWGDRHGIALFKFDLRGTVTPLNSAASNLLGR